VPHAADPRRERGLREDHRVVGDPGPELVSLGGRAFPVARAIAQRADEPDHDRASRNTNGFDEYVVERGQGDRRPLAWQPGQAEQVGQGDLLLSFSGPIRTRLTGRPEDSRLCTACHSGASSGGSFASDSTTAEPTGHGMATEY
jgi:hypothetical protein